MITVSGQTTISELAREIPASTRVFQQYGIDFCCGGEKTLAEASQAKGIALEGLLEELEKAEQLPDSEPYRDWNAATAASLIDHILDKHHAYLRSELPRLAAMMTKVIDVHGDRHPDLLRPLGPVYSGLKKELEEHMWKEENILFPLIRQMDQARSLGEVPPRMPVGGPIQVMEMEHESAGNALRQLRQISSDYQPPEDACNTYRALLDGLKTLEADLHEHIHLENNILFPKALELQGG
jgi:regulator of cell morphogenesis and NO signaling